MNRGMVMLAAGTLIASSVNGAATWQQTFNDDFDGTAINTSRWSTLPRWGNDPINSEEGFYTSNSVSVSGGYLHLKASRLPTPVTFKGITYYYQSGEIQTQGTVQGTNTSTPFSQLYGRFEIRSKAPAGKGFWPAFWLCAQDLSWPPEIDVFELPQLSDTGDLHHAWVNYLMPPKSGSTSNQGSGGWVSPAGYNVTDFHTYAIEWDAAGISWFIDDQQVYSSSAVGVPNKPMYMIVNLAVGGTWPGAPNANTVFPSELTVDYVRAYQAVVPEPSAAALAGLMTGVIALRRRRGDRSLA